MKNEPNKVEAILVVDYPLSLWSMNILVRVPMRNILKINNKYDKNKN